MYNIICLISNLIMHSIVNYVNIVQGALDDILPIMKSNKCSGIRVCHV